MPNAPTIRKRVVAFGRVQGVWYRGFARDEALGLGLCGWVRNNPDGSVEGVAEGPREAVESWLETLRQGPPLAHVEGLDVVDEPAATPLEGFRILR